MKNISHFITIIILILTCACLTNCSPNEYKELKRQKQVVTIELENLSPLYSGEELVYHSRTFQTIKKDGNSGHHFEGEVFFKDKYDNTYFADFKAFVEKGAWYTEISITEIEPLSK